MVKHATNFEMVMSAGSGYIVRFGPDDYGLYGRRYRNRFGTPLMARGTEAEMQALYDNGGKMPGSGTDKCLGSIPGAVAEKAKGLA